jgi:hypothetical protein
MSSPIRSGFKNTQAAAMAEFVEQNRHRQVLALRLILVACGVAIISFAGSHLYSRPLDMRWFAMIAFAVVASWVSTSQIPGDKGVVTASDTIVFLTLLLCGADAAILVAAAATASESARFTKRWLNFATNISLMFDLHRKCAGWVGLRGSASNCSP